MKKKVINNFYFNKNKTAQVWVETVIYTLIGLAVIGLLLAVAKPKIDSMKDKLAIEQSIESMNNINNLIENIGVAGNRRNMDLKVGKGTFVVDAENDSLYWEIESKYKYSEENIEIPFGKLKVITTEASPWKVKIFAEYTQDIKYNQDNEGKKEFMKSPTPYSIFIENLGDNIINFKE